MAAGTGATASQAWAILKRHARDEISPLRLQELCRDNDRVSSLVSVHNGAPDRMLLVDLSRQRMTLETLNHLLRLAASRNIRNYITRLAWGQNDPQNPVVPTRIIRKNRGGGNNTKYGISRSFDEGMAPMRRKRSDNNQYTHMQQQQQQQQVEPPIPSFHLSLRVPAKQGHEMLNADGTNILADIHMEWDRIHRISDSLRRGQLPGITGSMIRDVVVVGRGVPIMALRFVYLALCKDQAANLGRRSGVASGYQRRIKFLTSVDPVRSAAVVADLDPASTLVIDIALSGKEETSIMATSKTMKTWLLQSLGGGSGSSGGGQNNNSTNNNARRQEAILSKHMMLVTGNPKMAAAYKKESVFLIPEHSRSEPFCTFTAATLLPLSIVFGWPIVEQFLAGAHSMDCHFVETNPRHNLPILLALTDIWNDSFLGSNGRIISPYTEAFAAYPAFCACLEVQTCGAAKIGEGSSSSSSSSLVIDGGLHCAYDRVLYLGASATPSEMVMTMNSQLESNNAAGLLSEDNISQTQDALICSMFAHADELAFGGGGGGGDHHHQHHHHHKSYLGGGSGSVSNLSADGGGDNPHSDGNRPSTLLMCGVCDAFACGELVALAEHRAIVKARIWDVDPFPKEFGSALRADRTERLRERLQEILTTEEDGEDDDDQDLAGMNLSTKTILRHYASQVRDQRVNH